MQELSQETLQELQLIAEAGMPTLIQLTPLLSVLIVPGRATQGTTEYLLQTEVTEAAPDLRLEVEKPSLQ